MSRTRENVTPCKTVKCFGYCKHTTVVIGNTHTWCEKCGVKRDISTEESDEARKESSPSSTSEGGDP